MPVRDAIVLMFQAMQLPIIVLLVVFSIKASKTTGLFGTLNLLGDGSTNKIRHSPLLFPEIAFALNLFAIFIEILYKLNYFTGPGQELSKSVLGSLTTAFFFLGALFYFISQRNRIKKSWEITFIIITLILFVLVYRLMPVNLAIIPSIIDFIVFGSTTYFLYSIVSIKTAKKSTRYSNISVLIGFSLWTVLQVWIPVGELLHVDDEIVYLVGYTLSTVGKGFILFGLYNFSIKIADHSHATILDQTKLTAENAHELKNLNAILEEKSNNLEELNRRLQENSSKLTDLNKLANEIAACNENKKVISKMIDHLINSNLFHFDYAIFSKVDYIKGKILHDKNHAKSRIKSGINRVAEWVREGGVLIGHHDIMSQVVLLKEQSHAKADIVNGNKVDFTAPNPLLDKKIYDEYSHDKLDRLFIPVSNFDVFFPNKLEKEKGVVVGVLELGFNTQSGYYSKIAIERNREILSIYLNNIAQTYIGNLLTEENNLMEKVVDEFAKEEVSRDEYHIEFIDKVFKRCAEELLVDCGEFSFLSLDNVQMLTNSSTYGSIDAEEFKKVREMNFNLPEPQKRKGIFNYVAETKSGYYSNDVDSDPYYIPGLSFIKSQLSIPFKYNETVLGVVSLYSSQSGFFSDQKMDYAQRFLNASASTFLRLKLSFAVGSLVLPYSIYDKGAIYKATCERLSKYFASSFIAIWEGYHSYSIVYTSEKQILPASKFKDITDFTDDIGEFNDPQIVSIIDPRKKNNLNTFESQVLKIGFQSVIYIPIRKYKGKKRFITLLSKRVVENLFPEDNAFFSHISNKFLLSVTFFDVYNFFDQLTKEKYGRETDVILKDFMPMIKEITGSDIMLLFIYNQYETKFYKTIIYPDNALEDDRLVGRLNSGDISATDFSHSIITNDTQWIQDETQYRKYRDLQAPWHGGGFFKIDFWHREKIKSLAAIKIEFDEEELGVLFLNFREEQQFDIKSPDRAKQNSATENRKLIVLLANLIGRVIKISRTLEEDRDYLIEKSKESALLARSEVAIGMIHNIINLASNLSLRFGLLSKSVEKLNLQDEDIKNSLKSLSSGIALILNDYLIYKEYLTSAEFKIEELNVKSFFTNIESVLKYQIPNREAKLHFIEPSPTCSLYCDRVQFSHVILNLVKNAIEAAATSITIRFIDIDSTNQYSIIEVQDNGNGIKEEDRSKIFLPSYTSKKFGTGMGLPVSQDVIKNHGGRIDFKSLHQKNKNSGTTFSVYLPLIPFKNTKV